MTEKRFEQECNRFVGGVLLGIFDEAHPARSQRDDAARGAIVASIARYTDTFGTQPPAGESLNSSSQLIDAGYTDPILLLMNGYLLRTNGMEVEAIQRLQAVNQEQLKGPRGALARAVCLEQLAMANRKRNAKAEKEFERLAAESTLTAVREGLFREDSRILVWWLRDDLVDSEWHADTAQWFCDQLPGVVGLDPWVKFTLLGMNERRLAWDARGDDWAQKVKEKGWEGFAGHLAKAREHLVAAYRLDPSRPEAAAEMIPVTMGQNSEGESEEVWFERAVKAQVDFAPAYVSMSWALRPRWGGSTEAMYKLADRCASSDRFDTSVPYQCVLTLCDIVDDLGDIRAVLMKKSAACDQAKRVLKGYLASDVCPYPKRQISADLAIVLWGSGQFKEALDALPPIGGVWSEDLTRWHLTMTPKQLRGEIDLLSSPAAEKVQTADRRMRRSDYINAAREYTEASQEIPAASEFASEALLKRVERANVMAGLQRGETVSIPVSKGLLNWKMDHGSWKMQDDDSIRGEASSTEGWLIYEPDVGPRYEVSCSISILDDTPREAFWPGVIIGLTGTSPCRWYAVVFSRRNEVTEDRLNVVRRDHNKPGERLSVAIPRSESFHVRVQVWDEQIVVFVNDKMRFAGSIDAGQDLDFGARFALGNVGAKGKGVAVYSKMQLRLLSDRPQQLEHPTILKAKE